MEEHELEQLKKGFRQRDIPLLRFLGKRLARKGSLKQSHTLLEAAAASYAFTKIFQHEYPKELWSKFEKEVNETLEKCRADKPLELDKLMDRILTLISDFDEKTGKFNDNLIHRARVNKATTAYVSGISAGQAAKLSGLSKWDILRYAGSTKVPDEVGITVKMDERLKVARQVLK